MSTAGIFTAILAVVLVAVLERLSVPGRQVIGWIPTFGLRLVGVAVGGFLAQGLDIDVWWQVLIVQVVVAAILVLLVSTLVRGQATQHRSKVD